jgi:hypothetical protein
MRVSCLSISHSSFEVQTARNGGRENASGRIAPH